MCPRGRARDQGRPRGLHLCYPYTNLAIQRGAMAHCPPPKYAPDRRSCIADKKIQTFKVIFATMTHLFLGHTSKFKSITA